MSQETKVLLGIVAVTLVILTGAIFFLSNSDSKSSINSSSSADPKLLVKEDSNKITADSAKVTIVEFGDYQCPACNAAHPIVKQILKDYQGKVNFVFRHFPLPQHQNAIIAAQAAEAAGEQDKYWEMHNKLYEDQNSWAESNNPLEIFVKYAQDLNLNVDQFKASISSNKHQQKILNDKNDGTSLGINSTPTFYINGIKTDGFGYNEFKESIEKSF